MDTYALRRACSALLLFCLCSGLARAAPLAKDDEHKTFKGQFLFQGDMRIHIGRNGLLDKERHWPDGKVYFKISPNFTQVQLDHILTGMQLIQNASCVRFLPADEATKNYVRIDSTNTGCWSHIGYLGGQQLANYEPDEINSGCFTLGTIQHELLHTLGFLHQHSSADRDKYVKLDWDNIKEDKKGNFEKFDEETVSNFGANYDYGSVMHYFPNAFRANESGPSFRALYNINGRKMGQRVRMSDADIIRLNNMYKCKRKSKANLNLT